MKDPDIADLVRRVERLERVLEGMGVPSEHGPVSGTSGPGPGSAPPGGTREGAAGGAATDPRAAGQSSPATPGPRRSHGGSARGEHLLARAGIGFVLLALAFLLKLSFDRGWITPAVRLLIGAGIGTALLVIGLRLESRRRRLAQALLGGGVAIFYLVGYAGYQLYGIFSFWPALSLMTTTTFLSFVLSERQDVASLAVIGVSGGLATPFLLDTAARDPASLSFYSSVVLLGAGALQLLRGWVSLLATITLIGGLVVIAMATSPATPAPLAVSGGILVYWLVASASPLIQPLLGDGRSAAGRRGSARQRWAIRFGWIVGTTVAAGAVASVWDLERVTLGILLLVVAGGVALVARAAGEAPLTRATAGEMAALTAAGGLVLAAGWSVGLFLVVAEACGLWLLVERGAPSSLSNVAHILLLAALALYLPVTAAAGPDGVLITEGGWARLGMLVMVLVATLLVPRDTALLYRFLVHLGLLAWFLFELRSVANGVALVSVAWALQGAGVLLWAIRRESRGMKRLGLGTLALVAAKLLLVDLSMVDAVWRIFLFLGFGMALLGLSYLINKPPSGVSSAEVPGHDGLER